MLHFSSSRDDELLEKKRRKMSLLLAEDPFAIYVGVNQRISALSKSNQGRRHAVHITCLLLPNNNMTIALLLQYGVADYLAPVLW